MLVCVFLCTYCTRDRGCSAHPAFPAPSVLEEGGRYANLGHFTPRERESLSRMPSLRGALATKQSIPSSRPDGLLRFARNDDLHRTLTRSTLFRLLAPHLHLAVALGAAFAVVLRAALDGHRIVGHVLGDHRARPD